MNVVSQLIGILIMSSLINNVVLSQFLGLCPFLGVSKKVSSAAGMGGAIIFVITLASAVCGLLYKFILVPLDLVYLNTIVFILIIAMLVQFVEMFLKKFVKPLYEALGVYRVYVIYSVISYNAGLRAGHLTLINRGTILAYAQAASVVINIILNIVLIKNYGIYGAAAATAITQFLSLTVSNLFFKKDGREVFKWQIMALNPLEMLPNYRK
jgi:Na+-translocating ferredoxin:NAD+ oxidoreductase RnfA subunit